MDRSFQVYSDSMRRMFAFLKQTESLDDLFVKSIPLARNQGYLIPVSKLHAKDSRLIRDFMNWRQEHTYAFPTQFPVTYEGTEAWLNKRLLEVEDRMLFLVVDQYGERVGHLGVANGLNPQRSIEIDNVVRGAKAVAPGIMSQAMSALLEWIEEFLAPGEVMLRVFEDNQHAIAFYEKMGFVRDRRIPLKKQVNGSAISYVAIPSEGGEVPDKHFVRMVYRAQRPEIGKETILTAGPSVSKREMSYVFDAARNGWNHQWNRYIQKFEQTFAGYLGVPYALSTSSCTGALHIALQALGIGPGDEVIVPDITWVATANAVVYVGATPVFVDVDPKTWCMDAAAFVRAITAKTKAVIPVHLYGHPAPMHEIVPIARKHQLFIVEDAAPAIGAECNGQKVGTFGDFAAFSFQGAKLAVTGEGGILVARDEELFKRAYAIWDQGRTPGTFWIQQNGLKYKMSNLQAAFGLGQVEEVERLIEAKRRIFGWYAEGLRTCKYLQLNHEMDWARSIYWMTSAFIDSAAPLDRNQLQAVLKQANIDTRPVFPAISQYPHWPRKQAPQPIAYNLGLRALNLPSGVRLTRDHVNYVCNILKKYLGERSINEAHLDRHAVLQ